VGYNLNRRKQSPIKHNTKHANQSGDIKFRGRARRLSHSTVIRYMGATALLIGSVTGMVYACESQQAPEPFVGPGVCCTSHHCQA
jgi:hypothetical protein